MRTLYVSDLDGTLLQPDARLSDTTVRLLRESIEGGKLFTCATARTPATVAPILSPLHLPVPTIVMTGAAFWNQTDSHYSRLTFIDRDAVDILLDIYMRTQTSSFLYVMGEDHLIHIYHIGGEFTDLQRRFMEERIHNPFKRFHIGTPENPVVPEHLDRVILMYTMLPTDKSLTTYQLVKEVPHVRGQFYHDFYGPEIGILEAFSDEATKAKAIRALAAEVGADRTVAFGDNINDLTMMREADISVAVENALPEVKEAADIVIGPNTSDSVARFIHDDTL